MTDTVIGSTAWLTRGLCHRTRRGASPRGDRGFPGQSLLGSLIVTKLSLAALSRQDGAKAARHPHYLYPDEVETFIHGVDFPTILSEARKYRLALVIATQTLARLPPPRLAAVFGNCATVVSFRVGSENAKVLLEEFPTPIASQLGQHVLAGRGDRRGNRQRRLIRAGLECFARPPRRRRGTYRPLPPAVTAQLGQASCRPTA